ncbi:MAG: right-handed parallel beta-helix repeat-containing protein [Armatimonadota bacterium]
MRYRFGLVLLLAVLCASAASATVYVKWDSPGPTFDGNSWATAYHTVQAGINDADTNDEEVWVARGTYAEAVTLRDGVYVYGGFAGDETALSQRDWGANVTTIDGGASAATVTGADDSGIDGFVIKNSGINTAVLCSGTSPVIANNRIEGNYTNDGINCLNYSSPSIAWNTITRNLEGIYCEFHSSPVITNNAIVDNRNSAIFLSDYCSPTVANNLLARSQVYYGIYCQTHCSPDIVNNTVTGNAYIGVFAYDYSSPTVANNIVTGSFLGVHVVSFSFPVLSHNDVYGNTINYSGDASPGTGDISLNPLFDTDGYHLTFGSPCVDAGDDSVVETGWTDIDGQPRTIGAHVDIGADEYLLARIDIRPGDYPNYINLKSKGVVAVAVLSTSWFDARKINPATVLFAGAPPVRWRLTDIDHDGDRDLLLHFNTQDLDLTSSSTYATLTGRTTDGLQFGGTDTVIIMP